MVTLTTPVASLENGIVTLPSSHEVTSVILPIGFVGSTSWLSLTFTVMFLADGEYLHHRSTQLLHRVHRQKGHSHQLLLYHQ